MSEFVEVKRKYVDGVLEQVKLLQSDLDSAKAKLDEKNKAIQELSDEKFKIATQSVEARVELNEVKAKLQTAKAAIERRMKSDEACGFPFDENLGEALNEMGEI